eukprot:Gb_13212 [translate_table: standard]
MRPAIVASFGNPSLLATFLLLLLCAGSCHPALALGKHDLHKWSILSARRIKMSLKNYCESWRINVELHNLRNFDVVPWECVDYIGKYMTSKQYRVDSERSVEESILHLTSLPLVGDGRDAWVFDVDDTLLSTVPYMKLHHFGGEIGNATSFEEWAKEKKGPALPTLALFNQLKSKGVKIFIVTGRGESLRDATVENLLKVGFTGWTDLILRGENENDKTMLAYKSEKRAQLMGKGYRIWGNIGDQWSDITGIAEGHRTFKLPNPMYYSS